MALYAIGDVQGCYTALRRLLDKLRFDPSVDRLWFTGDLVNRGPQSVDVVRFVANLKEAALSVLGNHDLHLLAVASGSTARRTQDTFDDLLQARDREELLAWLQSRPLFHYDHTIGVALVHAGLLPDWDIPLAEACAREAEAVIRGSEATEFFRDHMYGNEPSRWDAGLSRWEKMRLVVNAFTRLRFCYPDGRADYKYKSQPGTQPEPLMPWFAMPNRASRGVRIVFGHWALLGRWMENNAIGVDSGCVWGRELSAVRLTEGPCEFISVDCGAKG